MYIYSAEVSQVVTYLREKVMASAFATLHGGETSRRQSDGIINRSKYANAAALVDLAEHGSGVPEEVLEEPNYNIIASKVYFIFVRFDIIWTLNYFALIAVQFFEQPLWCSSVSKDSCSSNRDYYYLGELPYLTRAQFLAFEGVTLIILVAHTLFPIMYQGMNLYRRNHVNKLKVISLLLLTVALVVDILSPSPVAIYSVPRRIAPYIRVAFFILNIRGLQDNLVVLGGMVGTYLNVLVLCLLFLMFSSWIAYVIYEDTQQGAAFFLSYSATLYQMFVLFTTSNNPDVWIPAYKSSRWSSLFFILYVLLGVYFVTNLVLAVIYDSFKLELAKQFDAKDKKRTRLLRKAFNLIDEIGNGSLGMEQCIRLFEELKNYRRLPIISREDFELIFDVLDKNSDDKINVEEFNNICHAIALKFRQEDTEPWLEKFAFYNSSRSRTLRNFVKSPKFGYVVAIVLFLNLGAVITETTFNIQNNSDQKLLQKVEFVFGWIYVLEMALKVYAYGFQNFWKDGQNKFDFIITWVIVIGETATLVSPKGLSFISSGECIRYLLIARMLRLIRLLMHSPKYRILLATFLTLVPSLMPYLGTIFCVMCIYCTLGIQVFGGIVNAGNPDLQATDLANNDYLLFNFNDYPNGMVTLFNLLVMGNWQIWMQDYASLTGTSWTYAYFISFYLITILLLLNLIVAFVLEAFFAETELEASEDETDRVVRRHRTIGIKTSNHRVDMILRHMLRSELHHSPPSP